MSKGQIEIHSQNILPIIKQWLYTDKDIFVRELVSNSCDAIAKRKTLSSRGELPAMQESPEIRISVDTEAKTLTFSDNGIGMNREEIVKYLAQVAFSSAEEFVEKYKTQEEGQQIIGHFGLGFYSAFMVADRVSVHSKRADGSSEAVIWSCDGNVEYEIEEKAKDSIGTNITLHINENSTSYLSIQRLKEILTKYCKFLPYPLFLGDERINSKEPLWEKNPSQVSDEDYLEFYRHLYPSHSDPMFWIHLDVEYPFHLKGILYFPKLDGTWQHHTSAIQLYCQRVFVSDDCKDLLPEYLTALHGAIDSPDIPLNVSRSSLQRDQTVRQVAAHISKKVADKLKSIFKNQRKKFDEVWPHIENIIKYGLHEDEKFFERVEEILVWPNLEGEYKTLDEYLKEENAAQKLYYVFPSQKEAPMTKLYNDRGIDILLAHPIIDPPTMSLIESKRKNLSFCRCDGKLDEEILDTSREDTILDSDGRTSASKLAEFTKAQLAQELEVEVKSLHDDKLPAMVILEENQRRMRDWLSRQSQLDISNSPLPKTQGTFVLNSNNPMIKSIDKLRKNRQDLASRMLREVYDLSLLSQGELTDQERQSMVERSFLLMSELSEGISTL